MKKILIITFLFLTFTSSVLAQTGIGGTGNPTGIPGNGDPSEIPGDGDPTGIPGATRKKICEQIAQQPGGIAAEEKSSIVPCGRTVHQCAGVKPGNEQCEFKHLFVLVNNLVSRFITIVFAPLLTIVLMYIGFLFIKEQAAAKAKAKALLWRVLVGTFFVLASWLIVNLILQVLGTEEGIKKILE